MKAYLIIVGFQFLVAIFINAARIFIAMVRDGEAEVYGAVIGMLVSIGMFAWTCVLLFS